ncbi:MAG: PfkB family carbohydrate kinase [Pseudomonadota bacterium]
MKLHAIGFGALNLDEFWEVSGDFLAAHGLRVGEEYVRDEDWFRRVYPSLAMQAQMKAIDPGGSAANAMAALHRMGFDTGFYGTTGQDGVRDLRLEELGDQDNLRIRITGRPAGRCLALIDRDDRSKDRSLVILPNANDLAGSAPPESSYFGRAQWVHMTSFVSTHCLQAQIETARNLAPGTRLSFDPGAVYCRLGFERLAPILRLTDTLFVTETELRMLTGETGSEPAAGILFETGVSTVVIKMGGKGIMAVRPSASIHQPAVEPAAVRDRTGAGDVAAAGFLAGSLMSLELEDCLHFAAICASRSIEGYGRSTYPDRELLRGYLAVTGSAPA